MGRGEIVEQMRARARDVRQDGSYGGLFEIIAWCHLKKVHVLLAFGSNLLNVYLFCGSGLRAFKPKHITDWWLCRRVGVSCCPPTSPACVFQKRTILSSVDRLTARRLWIRPTTSVPPGSCQMGAGGQLATLRWIFTGVSYPLFAKAVA